MLPLCTVLSFLLNASLRKTLYKTWLLVQYPFLPFSYFFSYFSCFLSFSTIIFSATTSFARMGIFYFGGKSIIPQIDTPRVCATRVLCMELDPLQDGLAPVSWKLNVPVGKHADPLVWTVRDSSFICNHFRQSIHLLSPYALYNFNPTTIIF